MIFGICTMLLIFSIRHFLEFCLVAAALAVRTIYLDRYVPLKRYKIPAYGALAVLLAYILLTDRNPTDAFIAAGRVLISGMVALHLTHGITDISAPFLGNTIGTVYVTAQRCFAMESEIISDIIYTFRTRWEYAIQGNVTARVLSRWSLITGLIATVFGSILRLSEDTRRLHHVRGKLAVTENWTAPKLRRMPVFIGDLFLIGVLGGAMMLLHGFRLPIPGVVGHLLEWLQR